MSPLDQPSSADDYQYVGNELSVFAHAHNWKNYFARAIRPYIRGNVLEVGAGIGATTRVLASGQEQSWTCLEPDRQLADDLRTTLQTDPELSRLQCQVIVGSLAQLPPESRFDAILYIDVLEHIESDRAELEHAAKHLAPQGHLIVLSPAHQWLFSPFDTAVGHFRRYHRQSLIAAGANELHLVRVFYLDSIGLIASTANRMLLRASHPSPNQIRFWDKLMVPLSRVLDPLFGFRIGKSIIGIWRRD